MTNADDLALIIELACDTEDRSDAEQNALLRQAAKLDNDRNAQVVTNKRKGPASRLLVLVETTRSLDFDDRQHDVKLPAKARDSWLRRVERWEEIQG